MSPADAINAAAKNAAAAPQQPSMFASLFAALLHAGDFMGAAQHIERSLMASGVNLLNSKLPPAVVNAVQPAEQDMEQAVETATGDAMSGNTPAVGTDLASGLGNAILDTLKRFGMKVAE